MKKFIEKLPLIVSILTGILLTLLMIVSVFASELTLEETKKILANNPYKIAEWIGNNMFYKCDEEQYTQSAEETFRLKQGDCEDWAVLSRYFIGDKYETHLIIWIGKYQEDSPYYEDREICHCVLAIKLDENEWGIIDNYDFISGGKTLVDMINLCADLYQFNIYSVYIAYLYEYEHETIETLYVGEKNENLEIYSRYNFTLDINV